MHTLLWAGIVLLLIIILALLIKLRLLQKSAGEIARELEETLASESNRLISISSRDPYMRRLAAALNEQLRELRAQRQRYLSGDRELKEAVTGLSHDLRTPLTAIIGYLDLLDRQAKPPEQGRCLSIIRGRAEAMKDMTEELFRCSVLLSAGDAATETVCLNAVLEESLAAFYAPLTERGIEPEVSLCPQPVYRQLDREALSRVIGNILSNALKYSGGDLRVSLDESGCFRFSNSAPGLDELQLGRLFDRYFTVNTANRSTGLGLSIAKALTEQLGGHISAKLDDGQLCIELQI